MDGNGMDDSLCPREKSSLEAEAKIEETEFEFAEKGRKRKEKKYGAKPPNSLPIPRHLQIIWIKLI